MALSKGWTDRVGIDGAACVGPLLCLVRARTRAHDGDGLDSAADVPVGGLFLDAASRSPEALWSRQAT